ncbi:putative inorganic phosphate cotransporter [Thrips palmi]|uniref:Inorganic phosphate cotransporter n=1 Tax=Thrips palmi TaxID=161013 RepID=A0A6P8ZUM3_THRPL|nr:putative inorganic phosphate cotransporter [Thrips palmi]
MPEEVIINSFCPDWIDWISYARPSMQFKGDSTYDWSSEERHVVLSSFFWGYVVTQVPSGYLTARLGPKWLMLAGVSGPAALSAVTPLVADWGGWQLLTASRVLQGLLQGAIFPATHAMLSRWSPPGERSGHTALTYNGMSVGTVVGMASSGLLAATPGLGWPSAFWLPGLLGLAWAVVWVVVAANAPASSRHVSREEREYIEESFGDTSSKEEHLAVPWRAIMTSVPMWALIVVHSGHNWGHWMLLTEMPDYMKAVQRFNIQANGLYSALPYLCLIGTSLLVAWLSQVINTRRLLSLKMSRKIFQSAAHWGAGTAMLVLALVDVDQATAVALLCVAVAVEAGTLAGFLCNLIDLSPNFSGAMMGVSGGAGALVAVVAPLIVGAITGEEDSLSHEEVTTRWNTVFILTACIYYIGNLVWVFFSSFEVQPWNNVASKTEVEPVQNNS